MMKWVAAAILVGAGIWGGVTWAIILGETRWRWIPVAIAVEAVIVAGAIVTPRLRPKLLLGAGVAVVMTASMVAYLLPRAKPQVTGVI
jgi:cobalamin biosynthesis protein CobD/CbiB